jgi:hypothetical protein
MSCLLLLISSSFSLISRLGYSRESLPIILPYQLYGVRFVVDLQSIAFSLNSPDLRADRGDALRCVEGETLFSPLQILLAFSTLISL